jgi:hypothetical protein
VTRVGCTCLSALSGAVVGAAAVKTFGKVTRWYEGDQTLVGERASSLAAGERRPDGTELPIKEDSNP